jgi:alkylhydroperoxidase family enzyme
MCRVATVNTARYEWDEHAPLLEGTGSREDAFRVLANKDFMGTEGEVLQALNPRRVAVFRYTDVMTKNIAVPEPIFEELRRL